MDDFLKDMFLWRSSWTHQWIFPAEYLETLYDIVMLQSSWMLRHLLNILAYFLGYSSLFQRFVIPKVRYSENKVGFVNPKMK